MKTKRPNSARIYEALAHEAALDASKTFAGLTSADRAEASRFVDAMRERVLAKQRADRAAARAQRVRPSIGDMARDAIVHRLGELLGTHPDSVFAHRDLTVLSDDDLRSALEDAETLVERLR
jgi:hypothetical protein